MTILCRPRMVASIFPVMFEAKLYTESLVGRNTTSSFEGLGTDVVTLGIEDEG